VVLVLAGWNPLSTVSAAGARVKLQMPQNYGGFFAFAFSSDDQTVAVGTGAITFKAGTQSKLDSGGEVLLWDAKTGKIKKIVGSHQASVSWIAWSQDGKTLARYIAFDLAIITHAIQGNFV
jgi:WD40 repeat protein